MLLTLPSVLDSFRAALISHDITDLSRTLALKPPGATCPRSPRDIKFNNWWDLLYFIIQKVTNLTFKIIFSCDEQQLFDDNQAQS